MTTPDKTVLDERIEKLKGIFDNKNIFDTKGFVKDCLGVGDTIAAVKDLVLMLSLIIIILLAVLMERSFISKERAETALMKAVGYENRSVIAHHTMRFGITVLTGIVTASVLLMPLTKLIMDPIFGIMGAIGSIEYQFNILGSIFQPCKSKKTFFFLLFSSQQSSTISSLSMSSFLAEIYVLLSGRYPSLLL